MYGVSWTEDLTAVTYKCWVVTFTAIEIEQLSHLHRLDRIKSVYKLTKRKVHQGECESSSQWSDWCPRGAE